MHEPVEVEKEEGAKDEQDVRENVKSQVILADSALLVRVHRVRKHARVLLILVAGGVKGMLLRSHRLITSL